MPVNALALVLAAGLLHASWNLILKRSTERVLVAAWAMLLGAVVFIPTLVPEWPPPAGVWPFVGASAVVYVAYYGCLARAYGDGDFSLVYPDRARDGPRDARPVGGAVPGRASVAWAECSGSQRSSAG